MPTQSVSYNVDDFCTRCQVCVDACPPDAILPQKMMVRGAQKWYVDFDKCIPFFNENFGCAICITVCPWSIPGRGPRIVEQLAKRAARKTST
jgi:epoxyqueuosine reductase QueG